MANLPDELPSYTLRKLLIVKLWQYRFDLSFEVVDFQSCYPCLNVFYKKKKIGRCLLTTPDKNKLHEIVDPFSDILLKEIEIMNETEKEKTGLNPALLVGISKDIAAVQENYNEPQNHLMDILEYGTAIQFKNGSSIKFVGNDPGEKSFLGIPYHQITGTWIGLDRVAPEKEEKNGLFDEFIKKLKEKK